MSDLLSDFLNSVAQNAYIIKYSDLFHLLSFQLCDTVHALPVTDTAVTSDTVAIMPVYRSGKAIDLFQGAVDAFLFGMKVR